MQEYCTLTRRELSGFFLSLTGYIVIAAAAFLIGFSFIPVVIPLMVLVPILAVVKIVQFIYFGVS